MRTCRAIVVALGLLGIAAPPLYAQPKLEAVTMAVPAYSLTFMEGYVADDLGLWAKHGLSVKSVLIPGIGSMNAVIGGSADVAQVSAITLTRAAARGQKMLEIAEPLDRLVVEAVLRKDLAEAAGFDPKAPLAKRALALKGRTIAVESINSIIHAYVRLLARRAGLDPEAIRIAVMQPPNMIAAFAAKQIDGFAMSLPWPLQPVLAGQAVTIASGPAGDPPEMVPFAHDVVVVRPDTCQKRPEICEGVGRSFAEAARFIKEQPDAALALMQKRFKTLDPPLLRAAFDEVRSVSPSPPAPTEKALENADLYNIDAGLMKPDEKLRSYADLFTDKYVK
ncbi:MAG TPA: ABC transporter substrate-binding protein [Stellaceae bacterium]|nr:ABC transporter substrate-binding protein [Stellaceae bacterium]